MRYRSSLCIVISFKTSRFKENNSLWEYRPYGGVVIRLNQLLGGRVERRDYTNGIAWNR